METKERLVRQLHQKGGTESAMGKRRHHMGGLRPVSPTESAGFPLTAFMSLTAVILGRCPPVHLGRGGAKN